MGKRGDDTIYGGQGDDRLRAGQDADCIDDRSEDDESPPSSVHDAERLTSRKLLAKLIDLAVCLATIHAAWYLLWSYYRSIDRPVTDWKELNVLFMAYFSFSLLVWVCLTLPLIYDILCIVSWGKTLGKHSVGIKVVRHDTGRRLGLCRAIGRGLLPWAVGVPVFVAILITVLISRGEIRKIIPFYEALGFEFWNGTVSVWHAYPYQLVVMLCLMVPPLVGYLPVLWSRRGRAWYDRMAGATVVKACEASNHPASPSWLIFRLLLVGPISLVLSLVVGQVLAQVVWLLDLVIF